MAVGKAMKRTEPQIVELRAGTLQGMLQRADAKQFTDEKLVGEECGYHFSNVLA